MSVFQEFLDRIESSFIPLFVGGGALLILDWAIVWWQMVWARSS